MKAIRNWNGERKGISGCNVCGDNWNWKKKHIIPMSEARSVFAFCEECWRTRQDHDLLLGARKLTQRWLSQQFDDKTMKDAEELIKNLSIQLKERKKTGGNINERKGLL